MKNMNRKDKARFTFQLQELICLRKMELKNSLLLMSRSSPLQAKNRNKNVSLAAKNLYSSLLEGEPFANSLKRCPYITFDEEYISFISFAQRCACLEEALIFLRKKCEREEENLERIVQVSVYPVFVILLAVITGLLFSFYAIRLWGDGDSIFSGINSIPQSCSKSLLLAFIFLFLFCITAFFILRRMLGVNKLCEAFLAMGFLIKGGESIANAVKAAVNILGYESKEGQLFAQAGKKLSFGLSLKEAFSLNNPGTGLSYELEEAFFYAENSGGENDVFEKIASWISARDEKRRSICLKLIEPVFISGTGIFILVFFVNLVLPLFSESTFFL